VVLLAFPRLALALALALVPASARAHGGDDHGPPAAASATTATEHVAATETELFTVVIKYPLRGQGGRLPLRIYVADAATSAPVAGASVRLELVGVADVRATAREPGIYETSIPDPRAGQHADAVVTIEAREVDILTLPALHFGPLETATPAAPAAAPDPRRRAALGIAAGGAGALVLAALVAVLVRRRRASLPQEAR
jgi:hypothetical protein